MQHYFLNQPISVGDQIILNGETAHRIIKVRRSEVGEVIELVDHHQKPYLAKIIALKGNEVLVQAAAESTMITELPVEATILIGSSKGEKNEFVIQKATEFGVRRIIIFNADYSIARLKSDKIDKKLERYEKIAQQAAEQSRRQVVPEVVLVDKLSDVDFAPYNKRLIAYEESAKKGEKTVLRTTLQGLTPDDKIVMVFGPEGGISPMEIGYLESEKFTACALGKRILRAEGAPMYFLSTLSYQLEMN